jgi:hypothetical protein
MRPEGWILGEALRVVHVLIASQTAVQRLPRQIGQKQLGVLSPTGIGQVLFDQFTQTQTFIQLPHQNQATVRGDARSLEIDLQGAVERELKGLVLFLTHGCWSPEHLQHFETHMNIGDGDDMEMRV